jgi:hypothetical protein
MRYQILLPDQPLDPRKVGVNSLARLYEVMRCTVECDLEEEAVQSVHDVYPSAVAMPIPLPVGSGEVMLLGILEDVRKAPGFSDAEIPFVMFVYAVAEHAADRKVIQKREQFSRRAWRTPVQVPSRDARVHPVEVRAADLESPMRVDAQVGRVGGHLVIHCDVGGITMSVRFEDPALDLR